MSTHTHTNRLEAFSDAVLAIIITIMVIELRPPEGADAEALRGMFPVFLSYILSFSYLAIYWNNHHHLLRTAHKLTTAIMWKNMFLLFWLSLIPFSTAWMGEHPYQELPAMLYSLVLLFSAVAYFMLQTAIVRMHGRDSKLATAIGADMKGKISLGAYGVAIITAGFEPIISYIIFVAVAFLWFVPDRRLERAHA